MRLSSNLRKFRRSSSLTQEELAAVIGVHTDSIGRYERGYRPCEKVRLKVNKFFGRVIFAPKAKRKGR